MKPHNLKQGLSRIVALAFFCLASVSTFALNPSLPPSGNFDLTHWYLGLPVDSSGGFTFPNLEIMTGTLSSGYQYLDSSGQKKYFFTGSDGAMVFQVPWNGSAKSGGSPRSELRQTYSNGAEYNWTPASDGGTHLLEGVCTVNAVGSGKVVIGQIHAKSPSNATVILRYDNTTTPAEIYCSVYHSPQASTGSTFYWPSVPLNSPISYQLRMVGSSNSVMLYMTVNGIMQKFDLYAHDPQWATTTFYFKAGAYYTDVQTGVTAQVSFYDLLPTQGTLSPGLTAEGGNMQVALVWSAYTGATSYKVKRSSASGGPYTVIASGVTGTNYTDTAVTNGTNYYYVVAPVTSTGDKPDSDEAHAKPAGNGLPVPWQTQDVGPVAAQGSASHTSGTFTLSGSGKDIEGEKDEFRFAYQLAGSDCDLKVRVSSLQNTHSYAKAGLMIRESLAANAAHAAVLLRPGGGVSFQRRTGFNAGTTVTTATGGVPYWLRLVRSGNSFTSYYSSDGTSWSSLGSATIAMGTNVYVGFAVTSHDDGTLCTATFDNASGFMRAPSGLSAAKDASSPTHKINLAWTDNASGESGFKIERKNGSGGTYAQIGTAAANATSYSDATAGTGTTCYYRVRATGVAGDTLYSNEANATTDEISGRRGHWKLDNNANDSSGSGNNATVSGSPAPAWVTGKIAGGLRLNGGSGTVNAQSPTTLDNLGPLTLAAWIKVETTGGGSFGRIVDKARYRFHVRTNNQLQFVVDYAGTGSVDLSRISANNVFTMGQWKHVAVTWDGTTNATGTKIYVDGSEVAYSTSTTGAGTLFNDASENLCIGNNAAGDRAFDGTLDDVRIYNRVLSASEIQAVHRAGL